MLALEKKVQPQKQLEACSDQDNRGCCTFKGNEEYKIKRPFLAVRRCQKAWLGDSCQTRIYNVDHYT